MEILVGVRTIPNLPNDLTSCPSSPDKHKLKGGGEIYEMDIFIKIKGAEIKLKGTQAGVTDIFDKIFDGRLDSLANLTAIEREEDFGVLDQSNAPMLERIQSESGESQKMTRERSATIPTQRTKKAAAKIELVDGLNLSGGADAQSFRDFYNEKKPKTAIEFCTTAVFYLERIAKHQPITESEVYTCARDVDHTTEKVKIKSGVNNSTMERYGLLGKEGENLFIRDLGLKLIKDLPRENK